ncbi:uncharacterized protein TNIN_469321 [Trichonephila inaurata madagascariensis]|uniref:Uncharacterized protein n=1 Tax=Trichonephila inaurata madagascariensis TaxID=2747483 RepID=A0A8X6Y5N9_9ARAC|nr:uncharacterized protein TNIN_469321 [Trichonephila inaurata madagascariensis]
MTSKEKTGSIEEATFLASVVCQKSSELRKMKFLVLLFLVGYASASFYDELEDAAEEIYHDFMVGMEEAGSLKEALGLDEHHLLADDTENDVKTELGKKLKETLDHLLEKIKDAIDHGKTVKEDLQNKLKEIKEKMKDLHIDMGNKAKELIEKIKEKSKEFLKNLLEKLGLNDKRSAAEEELEVALIDFNIKEIFNKLKKALLDKIDKEKLKEKIEQLFGKGSEMADALLDIINNKGDKYKQKLLDLIDRYLGKDKRSIKEYWEKVKDYFKDLGIDIKEKYAKFGEWVKNVIDKGLTKSKDKIANIKEIAREFIDHTKGVSKEVAIEALNFLKPYKEDLGNLYDQVKDTVKEILNRKD